jgi:hypothetical protein
MEQIHDTHSRGILECTSQGDIPFAYQETSTVSPGFSNAPSWVAKQWPLDMGSRCGSIFGKILLLRLAAVLGSLFALKNIERRWKGSLLAVLERIISTKYIIASSRFNRCCGPAAYEQPRSSSTLEILRVTSKQQHSSLPLFNTIPQLARRRPVADEAAKINVHFLDAWMPSVVVSLTC